MGLPALRHDTPRRERPRLTLVDGRPAGGRGRSASPKAASQSHSARWCGAFRTFLAVSVLFSGLGIARVALASRAAAVSIESGMLREELKQARFVGDSLEIKVSQLATPSRIRSVATSKMKMTPAAGVSYVTIDGAAKHDAPAKPEPAKPRAATSSTARGAAGESFLSSVMYAAAGEAQILLLGDVGLASSR